MSDTTTPPPVEERPYLPGMGKQWLLPFYDPFTRLFRVGKIHQQLLDQAQLRGGERVLEIGCGTANLLLAATAAHPTVTAVGLDPDPAALRIARRKARRRRVAVQFDRGYADDLPYEDGSVDVVLSAFMLHHLAADEREPAMREARRVLRPGGNLHLVDMGGHADPHEGRMARRAHASPQLHDNWGDGIPTLLRKAGFADVVETGHSVGRMGRFTFYRAGG